MTIKVTPELPVLIVGGGPGGLAFAQGLRKRGIPFRVFERDVDEHARGQGWAVALRWIIPRLRENLLDDVPDLATCSHLYSQNVPDEMAGFDGEGHELYRQSQADSDFIRADRLKLRELLRNGIDVEWNKRFDKYEELEDRVKVSFEDGSSVEGCCVVGADGGNSHVRQQLIPNSHPTPPVYRSILGQLHVDRAQNDVLMKTLARSVNVIQGRDVFIFIGFHEFAADGESAKWYWTVFYPAPEGEATSDVDDWSAAKLHEDARERTKELKAELRAIVDWTKTEDVSAMSGFMKVWSPEAEGWVGDRVCLLGDALHKVTPAGGTGVNHAIEDTVELCRMFDEKDSIPVAFKAYEKVVTKRAQDATIRASRWPVIQPGDA